MTSGVDRTNGTSPSVQTATDEPQPAARRRRTFHKKTSLTRILRMRVLYGTRSMLVNRAGDRAGMRIEDLPISNFAISKYATREANKHDMIYLARPTFLSVSQAAVRMLRINSVPLRIVAAGRLLFGRLDNLEIYSDLESCGRQRTRDDTCR